eukprot:9363169-Prorocentrum_lima.AAC.1
MCIRDRCQSPASDVPGSGGRFWRRPAVLPPTSWHSCESHKKAPQKSSQRGEAGCSTSRRP